jgi:hypothetical protein
MFNSGSGNSRGKVHAAALPSMHIIDFCCLVASQPPQVLDVGDYIEPQADSLIICLHAFHYIYDIIVTFYKMTKQVDP